MEVILNTKFLYKIRPGRMVVLAVLILVVMLIIAPIRIQNTLDLPSVTYIVLSLIAFLLGTRIIRSTKRRQLPVIKIDVVKLKRVYNITFWLGFIGIIFRYYDLFIYRGLAVTSSTIENMEMALEGSGNIISIIASILIFNAYIPLTIDLVCDKLHSHKRKIITLVVFLSLTINALLSGSRFAVITPVAYWLILLLYAGKIKFKISFRNVAIWLIILMGIGYVIGALFLRRLNDQNTTALMTVASSTGGYSDKVPATSSFQQLLMESEDEWYYIYLFSYANITQYGTHAVFEFPIVRDYVDQQDKHFYGAATFVVVSKFVLKLIGSPYDIVDELIKHNARPGIWSTFFSLWYLDFGWVGIFFMFLFGVLSQKAWANLYYGHNIFYLPIVCFLSIILTLILQLNFISGSGFYALFSFTMLPFLFKPSISEVGIRNE